MIRLLVLLLLAVEVLSAQTQSANEISCKDIHPTGTICADWGPVAVTPLNIRFKARPVTRDHTIKIWHWNGQAVSTVDSWAELPIIGFEYAVLCYEDGTRRRVHGADFYCWPSYERPDGLTSSLTGEALGAFIQRTECRLPDVRFGLMMTDRAWKKVEKEALEHTCEEF